VARTVALERLSHDERRVAEAFRDRRALSVASAQPLVTLGLQNSRVLRQLVTTTVVRRAGPHRYYLDEGTWANRRRMEWRNVLRTVVVVALVAMATALFLYSR
jgi:hypothetical protein